MPQGSCCARAGEGPALPNLPIGEGMPKEYLPMGRSGAVAVTAASILARARPGWRKNRCPSERLGPKVHRWYNQHNQVRNDDRDIYNCICVLANPGLLRWRRCCLHRGINRLCQGLSTHARRAVVLWSPGAWHGARSASPRRGAASGQQWQPRAGSGVGSGAR